MTFTLGLRRDDGVKPLPAAWFELLASCLGEQFEGNVARNIPFSGGYIIRRHVVEVPWVQLELSKAPFLPLPEKRARVLAALQKFVPEVLSWGTE